MTVVQFIVDSMTQNHTSPSVVLYAILWLQHCKTPDCAAELLVQHHIKLKLKLLVAEPLENRQQEE